MEKGKEKEDPRRLETFTWNVPPRMPLHPVLESFRTYLEGVRYKVGWRFEFRADSAHIGTVTICGSVADIRMPGHPTIEVFLTKRVDSDQLAKLELQGLHELVRTWVQEFEHHEIDEWLTIDGHRPFDPHKHEFGLALPAKFLEPDSDRKLQKLLDMMSLDTSLLRPTSKKKRK